MSALFKWNNFFLSLPRRGVWERRVTARPLEDDPPTKVTVDIPQETGYAWAPDPAVVDLVLEEIIL